MDMHKKQHCKIYMVVECDQKQASTLHQTN